MPHNLSAIENCNEVINRLASMTNSVKAIRDSLRENDKQMADMHAEIFATELQEFVKPHVAVETETIEEFEAWFRGI